jgi:hypothetical protein
MRKAEVYKSDDGQLEADPKRAIAHDIAYTFDRIASSKAVGTSGKITPRIDFIVALDLLENIDALMPHLKLWQSFREGTPPFRTEPL